MQAVTKDDRLKEKKIPGADPCSGGTLGICHLRCRGSFMLTLAVPATSPCLCITSAEKTHCLSLIRTHRDAERRRSAGVFFSHEGQ